MHDQRRYVQTEIRTRSTSLAHARAACRRWAGLLLLAALISVSACTADKTASEYYADARSFAEAGKDDAAVISLKNALRQAPGMVEARIMLGRLYLDHDDFAGAAKEFERAWRSGVNDPRLLVELVHAHLMAGEPEKAQAVLEDPRANAHGCIATALRGLLRLTRDEREQAADAFEKALAEDERCAPAFFGLARLALLKGQPEDALRYLEAVPQMPGLEKERFLLAAQARLANKDLEGAVSGLEQAVSRWPGSARVRLALAWAYLRTGDLRSVEEQVHAIRKRVRERMPSALLLEALLAYQNKDYEKARDLLRKTEPAMPGNLLLLKLLGGAHAALGEHEQAIGYLTKYLENVPRDRQALRLLLREQLAVGRVEDALAQLDARIRQGEADASLIRALGRLAIAAGQYDMLLGRLDQVRAGKVRGMKEGEIETLLGAALLGKGDTKAAIDALQRAIEIGEDKKIPGLALIRIYIREGLYDEAEQLIRRLGQRYPEDAMLLNAEGLLAMARENVKEARRHFMEALRLDPEARAPRLNLARLEFLSGDLQAAGKQLQDVLKRDPRNVTAMFMMAEIERSQGNHEEEIGWLERARKADSSKADLIDLLLLERLVRYGDSKRAREIIAALRKRQGDFPLLVLAEMQLLQQEGKLKAALRLGEATLEKHPGAASIRRHLVALYGATGQREKALAHLQKLAEQQPDDVELQARLAETAFNAHRPELGRRALDRVRKLGARPEVLAYLEAEAARMQGHAELAMRKYREVWKTQPNRKTLLRMLALSGAGLAAFPEQEVRGWLQQHPEDSPIRHRLALHLWDKGELAAAAEQYRKILARAPDDVVAWNNLALVALEQGDSQAALEAARKAKALQPGKAAVLDTFGWVAARLGRMEEGARALEKARELAPGMPEVLLHLAWVRARTDRPEEARDLYRKALELAPGLADSPTARELSGLAGTDSSR